MTTRPNFVDIRSQAGDAPRLGRGGLSPRIEHFDGEVPPALSPLDAFAAQGRLLAKQLDESMRIDRRLSRLPPASVARSLSQPRPGYFRSSSDRPQGITRSPTYAGYPTVEEPTVRPQSEHPRLSGLSTLQSEDGRRDEDRESIANSADDQPQGDYFGIPLSESPLPDRVLSKDSGVALPTTSRSSSSGSSRPHIATTLATPISPIPQSYSSSRLVHPESSDDDYTSSNAGSTFSNSRKLSSGSAVSMPHSPLSPLGRSHRRSPSLSSEASNAGGYLPRPSFNFSRPLSRSSTTLSAPSPVIPRESLGHRQQNGIQREHKPAPISVPAQSDSHSQPDEELPTSAVASYIYAKYSLPRGRMVSRNSLVFQGLQTPHFEWKEPLFQKSPPQGSTRLHTPSPPRPSQETALVPAPTQNSTVTSTKHSGAVLTRQSSDLRRARRPSEETTKSGLPSSHSEYPDDAKSSSADSASTVRPQTAQTVGSSIAHMSAEEHVAKGIECHEAGSLQESTYHLRIAAKTNHPTGMLLYALACRHGWGMRPNQREGVQWLRKAVDSIVLEVADNESQAGSKDWAERRARQAQFALSIYELGVSHLNGWGIEQDKSLALRCFEIAGQWGDPDALAEAGFCYAEGIGCKKDLKKAAKFYRMAEAKGMNIVGNSWIYKDKYMSDDESTRSHSRLQTTPDKASRSKSRTRGIFTRKKSTA
ncbi:hypothetical protein Egran_02666 [Elaphomyces granulatus]|uniref:Cell cycle inhibitor Nif1 n=1 Tax=Elaphomyces granulatus TaxID=519963 RepID=A0A232LZH6_9EURO|nr:hypothetical protein Egran_02666 [Elaphomyces granulatus]